MTEQRILTAKEVDMADDYILFDVDGEPIDRDFLEGLGHRVMVCHGPAPGVLCPILRGAGCSLAEGAGGIVFELDLDRPQHRSILARYRELLSRDIPIRVVIRPEQSGRYADLLRGLRVWTSPPVAGDLDAIAAEVEAARS